MKTLSLCLSLTALLADLGRAVEPDVRIKQVTVKQFKEAVAAHKGKIVVIDFWGTFCAPCKAEFHNLVEIHQKHAKAGVVCMSVAVDPSPSKEALAFLASKKAVFQNFLLDEDQTKDICDDWKFGAVPAVFVIDQKGKRHEFTLDDPRKQFTYKDVRALLAKLLEQK